MTRLLVALFLFTSPLIAQDGHFEVLTTLRPYQSIELSTTERGVIREILAQPGDEVVAGQVLIKLNAETIAARLAQAKIQAKHSGLVVAAEAGYNLSKDRFEIVSQLKKRATANAAELDRELATFKAREGELMAAREQQELFGYQVQQIEAELEQRFLRSPIDGVVTDVAKDVAEAVGQNLASESPYLIRVVNLDQLSSKAHIPYVHAQNLQLGQVLKIRLEDGRQTEAEAEIEFISPIVEPATGTVEVRLVVQNLERRYVSGLPSRLLVPIK